MHVYVLQVKWPRGFQLTLSFASLNLYFKPIVCLVIPCKKNSSDYFLAISKWITSHRCLKMMINAIAFSLFLIVVPVRTEMLRSSSNRISLTALSHYTRFSYHTSPPW